MSNKTIATLARVFTSNCGHVIHRDTPSGCHVAFWLLRTCPFLLLLVGTVGNVLNVIILSRQRMRKQPITVYLLFLAATDIVTLWLSLLRATLSRGWNIDIRNESGFICATQEWLSFLSGLFSPWLLVCVTIDRLIRTRFPAFAKRFISRRKALVTCIILLIVLTLLTVHLPFGKTYQELDHKTRVNVTVYKCAYSSKEYLDFHTKHWSMMLLILMSLAPLTVMLLCNAVIIGTLWLQSRRVRPTDVASVNQTDQSRRSTSGVTRMVVILSVYFMVATTPYNIYVLVLGTLPDDIDEETFSRLIVGFLVTYYLVMSNYALNFFFYFGYGPMFKREWKSFCQSTAVRSRRVFGLPPLQPETEVHTGSNSRVRQSDVPTAGTAK